MKSSDKIIIVIVVSFILVITLFLSIMHCFNNSSNNSSKKHKKHKKKLDNDWVFDNPPPDTDTDTDTPIKDDWNPELWPKCIGDINPVSGSDDSTDKCKEQNVYGEYNDLKYGLYQEDNTIHGGLPIIFNKNELSILGEAKAAVACNDYFLPDAVCTPVEAELLYPYLYDKQETSVFSVENILKAFDAGTKNGDLYRNDAEKWSNNTLVMCMAFLNFLQNTSCCKTWTYQGVKDAFNTFNKDYSSMNNHEQEEMELLAKGLFKKTDGNLQSPCWGCQNGGGPEANMARQGNLFVIPHTLGKSGKWGASGIEYSGTMEFMYLFCKNADRWAINTEQASIAKSAGKKLRKGLLSKFTPLVACNGGIQSLSEPCCLVRYNAGLTRQPNLTDAQKEKTIVTGSPLNGGIYLVNLGIAWHIAGLLGVAVYPGNRMSMTPSEAEEACPYEACVESCQNSTRCMSDGKKLEKCE